MTPRLSEPREPPARGPRQASDIRILAREAGRLVLGFWVAARWLASPPLFAFRVVLGLILGVASISILKSGILFLENQPKNPGGMAGY